MMLQIIIFLKLPGNSIIKQIRLRNDFKYLYRNIKSQLLSSYCFDAYGSQLWPFYDKSVKSFYVAWRRTIRKLWVLPNTTHCKYLHTINNSLPIDLMLEKRCLKFIWSSTNSRPLITLLLKVSVVQRLCTAIHLKVKTTDFCQINMIYGQSIGLSHFQLFLENFMTM